MATRLTLTSGTLTATVTAQNDTKAQEVLRLCAAEMGVPSGATNQQALDFIAAHLAAYIVRTARRRKALEAEQAALQDGETNVDF